MKNYFLLGIGHFLFWSLSLYVLINLESYDFIGSNIDEFGRAISEGEQVAFRITHRFYYLSRFIAAFLLFNINSFFLFKRFFVAGRKYIYFLLFILLVLISCLIQVGAEHVITYLNCIGDEKEYPGFNLTGQILFTFALLSLLYSLIEQWIKDQKRKKEIEKDTLLKEIQFLRSQINPHFLFNTINSLFSLASKKHDNEMAEGLYLLADMMRYMIDGDQGELKDLHREVGYIESYVNLQKIRFDDGDHVLINFDKQGDFRNWLIHPAILITFIENAFKHGISDQKTSIIEIELCMFDKLTLRVSNTNSKSSVVESTNIGIENVKKRLDLLYPKEYKLSISESEDLYEIILELILIRRW